MSEIGSPIKSQREPRNWTRLVREYFRNTFLYDIHFLRCCLMCERESVDNCNAVRCFLDNMPFDSVGLNKH